MYPPPTNICCGGRGDNVEYPHNAFSVQGEGRRALDLFSGTGSVGKRLTELGFHVTSLDIDPNRKPDIVEDVLSWSYKDKYPQGYFYIIAAGVSCNEYSTAKTIGKKDLEHADKIVEKRSKS